MKLLLKHPIGPSQLGEGRLAQVFAPSVKLEDIFSRLRYLEVAFAGHASARSLPFTDQFFDGIISLDSFSYYGTDDLYLNYLSRFLKPQRVIRIADAGFVHEIDIIPKHLRDWWTNDLWCIHPRSGGVANGSTRIFWTLRPPTRCRAVGNSGWIGTA